MSRPRASARAPQVDGTSLPYLRKMLEVQQARLDKATQIERERGIVFPETSVILKDVSRLLKEIEQREGAARYPVEAPASPVDPVAAPVQAPASGERSAAAVALRRLGVSQAAMAAALGVHQGQLSKILGGKRSASPEVQARAAEVYGVPLEAWGMAPAPVGVGAARVGGVGSPVAPPPRRPSVAASDADAGTVASVRAKAARLEDMVRDLLDSVAGDGSTPLEQARVMASAASTLSLLGKLTGDTLEISERQVLRSPAWRRVQSALVGALDPYPDAMEAVVSALSELEGVEAGA